MNETKTQTQSIRMLPGLVEDLTKRISLIEKDNNESKVWQAVMTQKSDTQTTLLTEIKEDLKTGNKATNEAIDEQDGRISTLEQKAAESKGRFWGIGIAASAVGGSAGAFFAKLFGGGSHP